MDVNDYTNVEAQMPQGMGTGRGIGLGRPMGVGQQNGLAELIRMYLSQAGQGLPQQQTQAPQQPFTGHQTDLYPIDRQSLDEFEKKHALELAFRKILQGTMQNGMRQPSDFPPGHALPGEAAQQQMAPGQNYKEMIGQLLAPLMGR